RAPVGDGVASGFGLNGLGGASSPGIHSSLISKRPVRPVLSITGLSRSCCKVLTSTDTITALPSNVIRPLMDPLPEVPRTFGPPPKGVLPGAPPGPGTAPRATTPVPRDPAPGSGGRT